MNEIYIQYYKTKYANFILGSFEDKLCLLDFKHRKMRSSVDNRLKKGFNANFVEKDNLILEETRKQIDEYFTFERKEFSLDIITTGTSFQKKVWDTLMKVPYGKTCSYLQLAKNMGNEKAVRAVANANAANAIALIIPCHRIIGSKGELTGYGGGLNLKKQLLSLEQNLFTYN